MCFVFRILAISTTLLGLVFVLLSTSINAFAQVAEHRDRESVSVKNTLAVELDRYKQTASKKFESLKSVSQSLHAIGSSSTIQKKSDEPAVDGLWKIANPTLPNPLGPAEAKRNSIVGACTSAISALDSFEIHLFDKKAAAGKVEQIAELRSPYFLSRIWNLTDPNDRADYDQYIGLIRNYDRQCLRDPIGDPAWKAAGLDRTVGVLTVSDSNIGEVKFCTAFRISNTRIATARHCTYKAVEVVGPMAFASRRVAFHLPLVDKRVDVKGPTCLMSPLNPNLQQLCIGAADLSRVSEARLSTPRFSDDWDILDIDDPGIPFPATVEIGAALTPSDKLTIGGLMLYAGFLDGGVAAPGPKDSWLRVPQYDYCRIVAVTNSCATYGCQTFNGTSGAPLIVSRPGNQVAISGIHVASTDDPGLFDDCPVGQMMAGTTIHGNAGRLFSTFVGSFTR